MLVFHVLAGSLLIYGCANTSPTENKISLTATTSIIGNVLENLAGDYFKINVLLPREAGPHGFQPHPRDMAKLSDSDKIFINGAGLESFLDDLVQQPEFSEKIVDLSQNIPLLKLHADDHHDHGHDCHDDVDPHTWMDPNMVVFWLRPITDQLIKLAPEYKNEFRKRAQEYHSKLLDLDAWINHEIENIPSENRKIVADHRVFGYFARRYNFIELNSILPSFSTLSEPSAKDIARLQDDIRNLEIPALLISSGNDRSLADVIAKDLGINLVVVYTGGLGPQEGPAATYIDFMKYNVSQIVTAMRQSNSIN